MFISDTGLQFSFSVLFLSGFGTNMIVGSQNEFRSIPSSELFCNSLRIGVSFSLNVWHNLLVKLCGPEI